MTTNQPPIPPAARPGGEGTPKCEHCGAVMDSAFADLCAECAAKNNRRIADYAAGLRCLMCGHAVNATDAPAAVSAPASEPTCAQCGHVHGALTGYCWHQYSNGNRCQCPNTIAARSPAPASGAPDEDRLKPCVTCGWIQSLDGTRDTCVRCLSARLAAAERAGEAGADALLDYDDTLCMLAAKIARKERLTRADGWDWVERLREKHAVRALNDRLRRAALTPTAPSPEERANG